MLAVHWTPVNNTKRILRNGITKSKVGVYCFPLTGNNILDKWWVNYFNQWGVRHKKNYNGIVFRVTKNDLPAYFGHWIGATSKDKFKKPILDLEQLGVEFRKTIVWRIGEVVAEKNGLTDYDAYKQYEALGNEAINQDPKSFIKHYNDVGFMNYTLEDYQLVLSNSIPAKRILKILPQGNEFGRILRKSKIEKTTGNTTS